MSMVHFVDTSVMVELLNIPHMNKKYLEAKAEYDFLCKKGDVFILPIAVLVEAGNHIAHISDGNMRRQIANKFVDFIKGAIKSEGNWNILPQISVDVLEKVLDQFPERAITGMGLGDLSIIEQFNDYWKNQQPIGQMRIWTYDMHLSGYLQEGDLKQRKDR